MVKTIRNNAWAGFLGRWPVSGKRAEVPDSGGKSNGINMVY